MPQLEELLPQLFCPAGAPVERVVPPVGLQFQSEQDKAAAAAARLKTKKKTKKETNAKKFRSAKRMLRAHVIRDNRSDRTHSVPCYSEVEFLPEHMDRSHPDYRSPDRDSQATMLERPFEFVDLAWLDDPDSQDLDWVDDPDSQATTLCWPGENKNTELLDDTCPQLPGMPVAQPSLEEENDKNIDSLGNICDIYPCMVR